jgi:hypothetical protein
MNAVLETLRYIKARMDERSTWMLFVAGISGASALPYPWNLGFLVVSVIAAFVPDGKMSK